MKVFWVNKRLAFGSTIQSWQDVRRLHQVAITHVVNLRSSRRFGKKLRSFQSIWLPFADDKRRRPKSFYRDALHFYERSKLQSNSKMFVMCHHGKCRSASLAYFLLRVDGLSFARAKSTILKAQRSARIIPAYYRSGEDFLSLYKVQQFIKNKRS